MFLFLKIYMWYVPAKENADTNHDLAIPWSPVINMKNV